MGASSPVLVCLIDDDELFRAHLADALRTRGFDVMDADSGPAGLAMMATTPPRVAIVDMLMPSMDGLEVLEDLRVLMPAVRTVIISAGGQLDGSFYLDTAKSFGADAVLPKPVDLDRLCQILADLAA